MSFFRLKHLLFGLSATALLMGCDPVRSALDAEKAEHELGVPVVAWSNAEDKCVIEQLNRFLNDYSAMNAQDREGVKNIARRFNALVVEDSITWGQISGDVNEVRLMRKGSWGKVFQVDSTTVGHASAPSTEETLQASLFRRGKSLVIRPSQHPGKVNKSLYATFDNQLFDSLKKGDWSLFGPAISAGKLQAVAQTAAENNSSTGETTCHPLKVVDLIVAILHWN